MDTHHISAKLISQRDRVTRAQLIVFVLRFVRFAGFALLGGVPSIAVSATMPGPLLDGRSQPLQASPWLTAVLSNAHGRLHRNMAHAVVAGDRESGKSGQHAKPHHPHRPRRWRTLGGNHTADTRAAASVSRRRADIMSSGG